MASPSTGEGHQFTSNFLHIYAAVGGGSDGDVCVLKCYFACLFIGLSVDVWMCVCIYVFSTTLCENINNYLGGVCSVICSQQAGFPL